MMDKILKMLRKEQKMTQMELAKKTGIDQALISKFESGERVPNIEKLQILTEYYDVSVDFVLGRTNKREVNR